MVGGTDGLTSPGDLWTAHELADFLGDDGSIDSDAVSAAVEALRTERPHWFRRQRRRPTTRRAPRPRVGRLTRGHRRDVAEGALGQAVTLAARSVRKPPR